MEIIYRYDETLTGFLCCIFDSYAYKEIPYQFQGEVIIDMNIVIREIESKDYVSVAAIWCDVLGFLSATDENVTTTYEKMKSDSRYCTFVVDVNGDVVGFTTTVETLTIPYLNGYIKMNRLAVLPEFQHRGIGKMLMEHVEKLAGERNASCIGLASGFQRTGVHEFYEHLGYRKTSFWFCKNIECC